ncbi:MAG: phosphoribosylformylglycinamidine synthase I [Candidatus Omnitrophota bacterium]
MKKIKAIILRTAGTNCDKETAYAFEVAGCEAELVHINRLIEKQASLDKCHILAIPGGFTYGDDIASGKILANELKFNLKGPLNDFVSKGNLIIGICNGFQVLVKMGLLPNTEKKKEIEIETTLSLNDSGKFIDKWVYLKKPKDNKCVWTKDLTDVIYLPIAHAEGKFITKDTKVLNALRQNGQIVFRYSDKNGDEGAAGSNPNGSEDNIAGITDPTGRILGMMPHPERHISYLQHPNWRRMSKKNMGQGLDIFRTGVKYIRENIL